LHNWYTVFHTVLYESYHYDSYGYHNAIFCMKIVIKSIKKVIDFFVVKSYYGIKFGKIMICNKNTDIQKMFLLL